MGALQLTLFIFPEALVLPLALNPVIFVKDEKFDSMQNWRKIKRVL